MKLKLATAWLDGCSGCHMSFLDVDHFLFDLADKVDLVYSPLVDVKVFPKEVDLTLVEGAVSTDEDEDKIIRIREHTKTLVLLGDCAITGNVPSMRNPFGTAGTLARAYAEEPMMTSLHLPQLLDRVKPVQEVVKVDVFVPGCPPPAEVIRFVIEELLAGRHPDVAVLTRFGK